MRLLIFSDSHSGLSFMRRCIRSLSPDGIIHLGDYYDDGQTIHEEFGDLLFYQVPGNCDRYRAPDFAQEILIQQIQGVWFYLTHGHLHGVKSGTGNLISAARLSGCNAVLYGHTHRADCRQDDTGMWILNPGSCGYSGGSAGVLEISDGKITQCRIIRESDLP